jgi:hypothetical protein
MASKAGSSGRNSSARRIVGKNTASGEPTCGKASKSEGPQRFVRWEDARELFQMIAEICVIA